MEAGKAYGNFPLFTRSAVSDAAVHHPQVSQTHTAHDTAFTSLPHLSLGRAVQSGDGGEF